MSTPSLPIVSIVTPVHNGERYLAESIESVLRQTYTQWEYLIVNNCSSDSTLAMAQRYAALDSRIRVHDYKAFVDVIESHNRALRLISPNSKYCKVLAADDWLMPECLERMVDLAEANQNVGIVGAYALRGGGTHWRVVFDGLPYSSNVVSGKEACRWHLLGGTHFLGVPSSVLYRADLVRRTTHFYPNSREHADISAFYEYLVNTDFGFIHQVLAYERVHAGALTAEAKRLSTYMGSQLLDVHEYGPLYLTPDELAKRRRELRREYYNLLAVGVVNFKSKNFWRYHKEILKEDGAQWYGIRVAAAVCMKVFDLLFNPKLTVERMLRRFQGHGASE
jgi:glycosyltransferase involved in cell wall biosynthesis